MRQAVSVRSARGLAALAVIAGVLAMHGLATAHHGTSAAPLTPAVMAVAHAAEGHPHASAGAVTASASHDCDLLCQSGEHGLALLCAAVLLTAAASVLVLRQRTGLLPRTTGPPTAARPRATAPPRSFDLVAELCISRT
jgi:hypothetical protein